MITKNETVISDWYKTKEKLPCEVGGQVGVIFCSGGWACAMVGMFTNFGETVIWSRYDQQEDRFEEWTIEPEFWMFMPNPPEYDTPNYFPEC
jgi:hypothetical protein